jgi:hypothetical protein
MDNIDTISFDPPLIGQNGAIPTTPLSTFG